MRIAGIIRTGWSPAATANLEKMREPIAHDTAESGGTWIRESLGLGVVWTRRSASRADPPPLQDEAGSAHLFFTGENVVEAQNLVRLYEQAGAACFEHLNGGFFGLLVNSERRHVVLFNDRYGSRRLYWHATADGFYFASEAKSLLAVDPRLREIDTRSLGEFLSCGCVLQNRTLFPGISILPAGARWTFHPDGSCERTRYFSPQEWEAQPALDPAEYAGRLRETLRRVLPRYAQGDENVGLSLTGGVDSRLILALAARREGLSCYTFGGPYAESADVRLARRLAGARGLPHRTICVDDEFLRHFPALAEATVYRSDGAMDVSGAVELYVNRRAREIAPVRLTGNYGSEILRSNVAFGPRRLDSALFHREIADHLRNAETTYAAERRCARLSFIAFKQIPWHHFARSAIEQSQVTMRSPYLDNELVKLAYQAPAVPAASVGFLLDLAGEADAGLARIGTDRAVRAHPIPLVSPIAHLWQQVAIRAEYAYDSGMPQWLAKVDRRLAPLRLERLFLGRHKFYHFRLWYRGALAEHVRAVLLDRRALQRPYVNGKRLRQIVESHIAGTGNYTVEIHRLLTLELLHRLLLERN